MGMKQLALICTTLVAVSGCVSTPEHDPSIDQLQARLDRTVQHIDSSVMASIETHNAIESIEEARRAIEARSSDSTIQHRLFVSQRRIDILEHALRLKQAEKVISNADLARKEVQLRAKTQEAQQAKRAAQVMQTQAAASSEYAQHLESQLQQLQSKVKDLQVEETARGLVLTLGNILFEFDSANLRQNTRETLQEIAVFLKKYPERALRVEGFTDSTGSADYNQNLSLRRADAVRESLIDFGVDSARISIRGYGEQYPVVANDSEENRQRNRRVEIVLANSDNVRVEERGN